MGRSLTSVDGDRALVGALYEDGTDGVSGEAGAAYIYERQGGGWQQVTRLSATDAAAGDNLGIVVSLSGDRALAGAWEENDSQGAAYLFERAADGSWAQAAKLVASDGQPSGGNNPGDKLGASVSVSGDRAVVGTESNVGAYVFERQPGGTWSQTFKLVADDAGQTVASGNAVAVSGDVALVGAANDGAVFAYERQANGSWTQTGKLVGFNAPIPRFGASVAISGQRALIGASSGGNSGNGEAWVYERQADGTWEPDARFDAGSAISDSGQFGYSVSLSGDRAIVGAIADDAGGTGAGAAYVFDRLPSGIWEQNTKLVADNASEDASFGLSVSLDGNRAMVGSFANAAYAFERTGAEGPPGEVALVSPVGNAGTRPTYTWNALGADPAVSFYYLWLENVNGVVYNRYYSAAAAGCDNGTGTCSVTPNVDVGGDVLWYVQAYNGFAGEPSGPWGSGLPYRTGVQPNPGRVTNLIAPDGAGQGQAGPYRFDAVTGATFYQIWVQDTSGAYGYRWYASAALGCAAGGVCSTAGAPQPNLGALSPAQAPYTWYVRAYGADEGQQVELYGIWSFGKAFSP